MKLIVFLGNPGKKYQKTRHNTGWLCADFLQKSWAFPSFVEEKKFFGDLSVKIQGGEKIFLLKPKTFMNLSGKAVLAVMQFFKIPLDDVLIIFDDKDQKFGNIRFRKNGGAGGHNGIDNILSVLGTEDVARIKIGIDSLERTEYGIPTADFVLSEFSQNQYTRLFHEVFLQVEEKCRDWISS